MERVIQKWGNSLGVRIPAEIAKNGGLTAGTPVDLRLENGNVVMVVSRTRGPSLESLVRQITPGNRHEAIEFLSPVGHEAW